MSAKRMRTSICAAALAASAWLAPAPAVACELGLVLAIDVSGSVSEEEFRLQMDGLAAALRSPEVASLLVAGNGVEAMAMQWSGAPHQEIFLPWRRLDSHQAIADFARRIAEAPRAYGIFSTAIGQALAVAGDALAARSTPCRRQVIDVSGDGRSNEGVDVATMRDRLAGRGVSVNALVITGSDDELADYFRRRVIGGPAAFVMSVRRFADYPEAIKLKLIRELSAKVAGRRKSSPGGG